MIDIIDDTFTALETNEILGRGNDITGFQHTLLELHLQAELLINLVATHATEVVTLWIEE